MPGLVAGLTQRDRYLRPASARLYEEIARDDPQPFKQRLAAVAHDWACHRGSTTLAALR